MANTKERSGEFARIAIAALEEKKATEIRVIDISEVSVLADYFIIANGSNRPQMQAMSDEVSEKMEKAGAVLKQVEGYDNMILRGSGETASRWTPISCNKRAAPGSCVIKE